MVCGRARAAKAYRCRHGVQSRQYQEVAQTQNLDLAQRVLADLHLRQDVRPWVSPAFGDHGREILEQLARRSDIGFGRVRSIRHGDDGVFPADQTVTVFERQAVQDEKQLKRKQIREIGHRLALAPACDGVDHSDSVTAQRR